MASPTHDAPLFAGKSRGALQPERAQPHMPPRYPHRTAATKRLSGAKCSGAALRAGWQPDSNPAVGRMIESGLVDQAGRATSWWACGPWETAAEVGASRARFAVRGDQCGVNA